MSEGEEFQAIAESSPASSVVGDEQLEVPDVSDALITLQVGEREFRTRVSTLTGESAYFASMLSDRWFGAANSVNNIVFVDADPKTFQHILHYLRRGAFPLLWKRNEGFDYGLYASLLQEARYFGVEKLQEWIAGKKYLNAVTVQHAAVEVEGSIDHPNLAPYSRTFSADIERSYHPSWKTKSHYRCPRGILIHHGDPKRCGRACENAKVDGVSSYEDIDVLHTLIIEKKTVVDYDACLGHENLS